MKRVLLGLSVIRITKLLSNFVYNNNCCVLLFS